MNNGTILACFRPRYGSTPMKKPSEYVPEGVNERLADFLIKRQAGEGGVKQHYLLMSDSLVVPRREEGWRLLLIKRGESSIQVFSVAVHLDPEAKSRGESRQWVVRSERQCVLWRWGNKGVLIALCQMVTRKL